MGKILLCSHHRKVEIHLGASTADEMRSCLDNLWLRGYRIWHEYTDHVHGRLGKDNRYQGSS